MAEPLFVRWLRTESERERADWLPWHPRGPSRAGAAPDVSDPDRLVLHTDISDLLVEVPPVHHPALYRLLLSLLGLPLSAVPPGGRTSTELASEPSAALPTVRPAFAWASLLELPRLAPPAFPFDADTVFPQPGAYPFLSAQPGAVDVPDAPGAVLVWGTNATVGLGPEARPGGQLTDDQVAFVRSVALDRRWVGFSRGTQEGH